jgi:hypothetical protein
MEGVEGWGAGGPQGRGRGRLARGGVRMGEGGCPPERPMLCLHLVSPRARKRGLTASMERWAQARAEQGGAGEKECTGR